MIYKNGYLVKALYKGASPVKNVFKGSNLVFGNNEPVIECDDVLSFKFNGSVNFKINNTQYTANESPYTTTLSDLGISSFTNAKEMFNGWNSEFTEITKIPCTDNVTNMNGMFRVCSALTSLDLSSFNTTNVTDMSNMFNTCSALSSLDLSSFNTSKLTNVYAMFQDCQVETLNVSGWDISKITSYADLFSYCRNLSSLILGDVTQEQYNWWYQRLVDAGIQNNVTITYNLI